MIAEEKITIKGSNRDYYIDIKTTDNEVDLISVSSENDYFSGFKNDFSKDIIQEIRNTYKRLNDKNQDEDLIIWIDEIDKFFEKLDLIIDCKSFKNKNVYMSIRIYSEEIGSLKKLTRKIYISNELSFQYR